VVVKVLGDARNNKSQWLTACESWRGSAITER
jgi:hypothetical protein